MKPTLNDLPRDLEIIREELVQRLLPFVRIRTIFTQVDEKLEPWASHFKGFPYMETGESFPTDSEGYPLFLLAQINFDELDAIPNFPSTGLLQFFIPAKNSFTDADCKVIYRETYTQDTNKIRTDFSEINYQEFGCQELLTLTKNQPERVVKLHFEKLDWQLYTAHQGILDLYDEYKEKVKKSPSLVTPQEQKNVLVSDYLAKISEARQMSIRLFGTQQFELYNALEEPLKNPFDDFEEYIRDIFDKEHKLTHQIGGDVTSWQEVGLVPFSKRVKENVLLLQIDCDTIVGLDLWGGSFHFLIDKEDLESKNFEKIKMEFTSS